MNRTRSKTAAPQAAAPAPQKAQAPQGNDQEQLASLNASIEALKKKGVSVQVQEQDGSYVLTVTDGAETVHLPADGFSASGALNRLTAKRDEDGISFDPDKKDGGETPKQKAERVKKGLKVASSPGGSVAYGANGVAKDVFGVEDKNIDKVAEVSDRGATLLMNAGAASGTNRVQENATAKRIQDKKKE